MEDKKNFDNGVICTMPWTHISFRPNGYIRPCSWTDEHLYMEDGKIYNLHDHNVEHHESQYPIQKLKSDMLSGEKNPICNRCYEQEKLNDYSKRKTAINGNYNKNNLKKILNEEEVKISRLELRLGNFCNIGCITCNPWSSNFFIKEIKKKSPNKNLMEEHFVKKYEELKDTNIDWFKKPDFWNKIERHIPNLNYIYIAGGEPTIINENWNFLQKCIDNGYAKNITLGISTNLTNVKDKHIEIYNSFEKTIIYCSVDAYGNLNDYIRYPSKWKSVEKNVEKLIKQCNSNVELLFIPVISIFSIFQLEKLWAWTSELQKKSNISVRFNSHTILKNPGYQSIKNLPDSIKKELISKIKIEKEHFNLEEQEQIIKVIKYLENSLEQGNIDLFYKGKIYTETFDKMRNNNWKDYIPELIRYWNSNEYKPE